VRQQNFKQFQPRPVGATKGKWSYGPSIPLHFPFEIVTESQAKPKVETYSIYDFR